MLHFAACGDQARLQVSSQVKRIERTSSLVGEAMRSSSQVSGRVSRAGRSKSVVSVDCLSLLGLDSWGIECVGLKRRHRAQDWPGWRPEPTGMSLVTCRSICWKLCDVNKLA